MYLDPSGPHSKSQGLSLELIRTVGGASLFATCLSSLLHAVSLTLSLSFSLSLSHSLARFIVESLLPGLSENARRSSSRSDPQRSSIHRPLAGLMPFFRFLFLFLLWFFFFLSLFLFSLLPGLFLFKLASFPWRSSSSETALSD